MRKLILLSLSLMVVAALIFCGCSQNQSTAPDTSSAALSQKVTTSPNKDVFIGWSGDRPDAALAAAGAAIKREYKYLPIVFASVPEKAIGNLKNHADVKFVSPPAHREYHAQTLDWGVDRIDAEYVWTNSSYDGSGVNVAILDTGGDMDHPDLTWAGGFSTVNAPDYWEDRVGHGTHCAGIVSADSGPMCPRAPIAAQRTGHESSRT